MNKRQQARALISKYKTVEALQAKLDEATAAMESGSVITSASSSGGTSYARTVFKNPAELVELYQLAIDIMTGEDTGDAVVVNVSTI